MNWISDMLCRYWKFWIATVALAMLPCLTAAWPAQAEKHDATVLATVNDFAITQHDLTVEAAQLQAEMDFRNRPISNGRLSRLRKQLIENLINRELLYQIAQHRNIQIQKRWIDLALKELKEQLGGRSAYRQFLAKSGLTGKQLKARIKKGLIVRRLLRREVIRQIKVSEAEMQAFYQQHPEYFQGKEQMRLRHILIAFDDKSGTVGRGNALLRIQSIQLMLHENKDFASLALEHSDDPSKVRGGDLGYLEHRQLIKDFGDAAFALAPGEVSDIVETRYGYHLIKAIDRIPSSRMAYRNVRDKIERTLRRNKEKKATEAYLANQRRRASITRQY